MGYELSLDILARGSTLIGHLRSRQSRAYAHTWNDILDRIYVPDSHNGFDAQEGQILRKQSRQRQSQYRVDTSADDSSLIRQYLVHSAHTSGRCVRGVWIGGVTLIICELSPQLSRGDTCETSCRIKSTRVTYTYVIGISYKVMARGRCFIVHVLCLPAMRHHNTDSRRWLALYIAVVAEMTDDPFFVEETDRRN